MPLIFIPRLNPFLVLGPEFMAPRALKTLSGGLLVPIFDKLFLHPVTKEKGYG
jgi:hypothetical protein